MQRMPLQTLVVACLVILAGCATTGQTTTTAPTTTATTQTSTATTVTATETTTVPQADSVPFVLENKDNSSHSVHLVIRNESSMVYNDTVALNAGAKHEVATLTGQGNTYHVTAKLNGSSFERNVTLNAGLLQSGITINESGKFEYSYIIN